MTSLTKEEMVHYLQMAWDLNVQLAEIPPARRGSILVAAALLSTAQAGPAVDDHPLLAILPKELARKARKAMLLAECREEITNAAYHIGHSLMDLHGEWDACFEEQR